MTAENTNITCFLTDIFEHQAELHRKFFPIEVKNGIGGAIVEGAGDFSLDDRRWQAYLKDMSYRVVEELAESLDEMETFIAPGGGEDVQYFDAALEELIDALHFLTEYCIVVGMGPHHISGLSENQWGHLEAALVVARSQTRPETMQSQYAGVMRRIGMASNLLKARPWKQSEQPPVDEVLFRGRLQEAYIGLLGLLNSYGLMAADIHRAYTQKNATNHQRISDGK